MTAIHAWAPCGPSSPSVRVRLTSWADAIPELRTATSLHPFTQEPAWMGLRRHPGRLVSRHAAIRSIISSADEARVSIVHRELSPLSSGGLECKALERGAFALYDVDDALIYDSSRLRRERSTRSAQHADLVLAGNHMLAEAYDALGCEVMYLPSCVNTLGGPQPLADSADGRLTVGWIGSATTVTYLEDVRAVLEDRDVRSTIRFVLMGPSSIPTALSQVVEHVPWTLEGEHDFLTSCDVGMMPLPDSPWARGKCAYKLLQYGSVGRTFLASPVGANAGLISDCGALAASSLSEWREGLIDLGTRPRSAIEALGQRAFEVVNRQFSYSAWAPAVRELLIP